MEYWVSPVGDTGTTVYFRTIMNTNWFLQTGFYKSTVIHTSDNNNLPEGDKFEKLAKY